MQKIIYIHTLSPQFTTTHRPPNLHPHTVSPIYTHTLSPQFTTTHYLPNLHPHTLQIYTHTLSPQFTTTHCLPNLHPHTVSPIYTHTLSPQFTNTHALSLYFSFLIHTKKNQSAFDAIQPCLLDHGKKVHRFRCTVHLD